MLPDARLIEDAVALLDAGELVAFPTETVYGLGADAANAFAVARIFAVKGRPSSHPLIVHFSNFDAARAWVAGFVAWYNAEHLHSAIRYVTPNTRHARRDGQLLAGRHRVYTMARARTPRRWARHTRNWTPVGAVALNPVSMDSRVVN